MLDAYRRHAKERAAINVVPLPLSVEQTADLIELIKNPPAGEQEFLLELLSECVPPGVDQAAYVKAAFLADVAKGNTPCELISRKKATFLLGTMLGGYNIQPLIDLLDDAQLADTAADALKKTLLMFDAFHLVKERMDAGNASARAVMESWASAQWFTDKPELAEKITLTVFMVSGETNTDDLSPAPDAWSRPDIPLHANAMLKMSRGGIEPDEEGQLGPMSLIQSLKEKGHPLVYVGDVVGTGSSRKSATNSVLWHIGNDIPHVPNKRAGGFCIGGKIAPIFFNTMEDAGALPIEMDVSKMSMGDVIDLYPYQGVVKRHDSDEVLATFKLKTDVLLDEVRGWRAHSTDYRSRSDRACAGRAGLASIGYFSTARVGARLKQRVHLGAKNGRSRLWPRRCPTGHLLRAQNDHCRLARHHRTDDARRAQGLGLSWFLG